MRLKSVYKYEFRKSLECPNLDMKLLEKVEELTRYMIELKQENEQLKSALIKLKN